MTTLGHFLPHFIDWMERRAGLPPDMKVVHSETISAMKRANRNGVCFALKEIPPAILPETDVLLGEYLRPPYPTTVVEYKTERYNQVVVAEDLGTHVKLRTYSDVVARSGIAVCPYELRLEYGDLEQELEVRCWARPLAFQLCISQNKTLEEVTDVSVRILHAAAKVYSRMCALLVDNHVDLVDIAPDAKENRIRRIKGQAPLYTYKTLVIGPPKKRHGGKSGGAHASPRSHLRRGFYRTSRKGVRHWVKATMVMGETPGFVHKDYQVQQGEDQ